MHTHQHRTTYKFQYSSVWDITDSEQHVKIVVLVKLNHGGSVKENNLYDNLDRLANSEVKQSLIYQHHRAILLAAPFEKLDHNWRK